MPEPHRLTFCQLMGPIFSQNLYRRTDKESNTPSTTPSSAAKSTRKSGASRKVIVWAGYQKSGMVRLKTKPHCRYQSISESRLAIGIGVIKARREPPEAAIWASVIL